MLAVLSWEVQSVTGNGASAAIGVERGPRFVSQSSYIYAVRSSQLEAGPSTPLLSTESKVFFRLLSQCGAAPSPAAHFALLFIAGSVVRRPPRLHPQLAQLILHDGSSRDGAGAQRL